MLSVMWSVIPEHLLWTNRSHEVHKMGLAPTPMVHTPQGYFWISSWNLLCSALETRIFVLLVLTRKSIDSSEIFQDPSLFWRSTRKSLKIARLSLYGNSHRQQALNSLDKASILIVNSKGLSTDPWCTTTGT